MKIEQITIWAVYSTYDETGRDSSLVSCWETQLAAQNNRKGHGWYGGPGNVRELPALQLPDGRIFVLLQAEPVKLGIDLVQGQLDARAAALAKLSIEERKLLGLPHAE